MGILDAVTDRESGSLGQTLEPRSNYFVGRVQQELGAGKGNVGVMLTGVNRQLDDFAADSLRRTAYTAGIDFRRDFHSQDYRISGYVVKSQVAGSARSIALTQANSTHYFQKPGDRESSTLGARGATRPDGRSERVRICGQGEPRWGERIG